MVKKIIKNILYNLFEVTKICKKKNVTFITENNIFEKNPFKTIEKIKLKNIKECYKWVGAVNYNNYMYCIPNQINNFLKVNMNDDKISYISFNSDEEGFRWTGGCVYKKMIYGFPRRSNYLICLDPTNDIVKQFKLNTDYDREHHYGGVVNSKGIVIQPPRRNNTILLIDLNKKTSKEIKISPAFLKYSYSNCIYINDELIYFFPENNERVLVYNSLTESFYFTGNKINAMVFDGALHENVIFGFSAYNKGILKIDISNNEISMIHSDIFVGSYGTKKALNGKIYSIPGNSNSIYEFNPKSEELRIIYKEKDICDARCAGGVMSDDGTIYTVPALGNVIYKIIFDEKTKFKREQIELYQDNY